MADEFDKAIADFTAAVRCNPQFVEAYLDRGNAYEQLGKHDAAIADDTKVIQSYPRHAEAYYCRGVAYRKKGETAKAQMDFAKAEKLGRQSPAK